MDDFKEFQGSGLDNAIKQACSYYNVTREKLEIDIIQDAKTGIFGLVGARKAKIKARRVQLRGVVDDVLADDKKKENSAQSQSASKKSASSSDDKAVATRSKEKVASKNNNDQKAKHEATSDHSSLSAQNSDVAGSQVQEKDEDEIASYGPGNEVAKNGFSQNIHKRGGSDTHKAKSSQNIKNIENTAIDNIIKSTNAENIKAENGDDTSSGEVINDGLVLVPFEKLDHELLKSLCFEAVKKLTFPVVGEVPIYVEILDGRVSASLDCGDDSGLLIGREGQTLASIQYLASRVVSRQMKSSIRVQLDAGEYRLRQDEKLKSIALALAERVKSSGRSYSTRPLSSYHRRIVHMALQDSLEVQTRSSGDGALKRVIVQRKRG